MAYYRENGEKGATRKSGSREKTAQGERTVPKDETGKFGSVFRKRTIRHDNARGI